MLKSSNSVKRDTVGLLSNGPGCRVINLSIREGARLLVHSTLSLNMGEITMSSPVTTTGLRDRLPDSVALCGNRRNLIRLTHRSTSVILYTIINVTKLHPILTTVRDKGSVTLTAGRILITTNRTMVGGEHRYNIEVLPMSDRRDTVFRSLRSDLCVPRYITSESAPCSHLSRDVMGHLVLATSKNPFTSRPGMSFSGIALSRTLTRPE